MLFFLPLELKPPGVKATIPTANAVLIAINVLAFCLGVNWHVGPATTVWSILTYGFCHGSIWHLAANMWVLWVFGNPVNRRLGNLFYTLAYLGSIMAVGLAGRILSNGYLVGASGGVFAIIAIAMMLMPSARLKVGYLALFPFSLIVGLLKLPEHWLYWVIRWGRFSLWAIWGLALIPILELWSFFWSGWNGTHAAHLLGMLCGVVVVLMLPTRISMGRRAGVMDFT